VGGGARSEWGGEGDHGVNRRAKVVLWRSVWLLWGDQGVRRIASSPEKPPYTN